LTIFSLFPIVESIKSELFQCPIWSTKVISLANWLSNACWIRNSLVHHLWLQQ
jgi:hypothetical protein